MNRSTLVRFTFLFAAATFLTISAAKAVGPLDFYSVTPCRLVDTRDSSGPYPLTIGPVLQHGQIRNFPVYGSNARPCGIPNDTVNPVRAVTVNVTVVNPTSLGHLTVFPYNTTVPVVSMINYNAGEPALGNGAIVPLTNDASYQISVLPVLLGTGNTVHVIIDITGYFQ